MTAIIISTENERIKSARKLRNRQQRLRTGLFLIEGVRLIQDALESGAFPEQLFYAAEIIQDRENARELVNTAENLGVACFPVSVRVLESLSDTLTPQGLAAVVKMQSRPIPTSPTLVLILDGLSDPGNAGTLMRSAEAAGAELVIFGPHSVDAHNDKVVRAAMGAHFRLPLRQFGTWDEVWSLLDDRLPVYVADAGQPLAYFDVDLCEPAAIVVGSEAFGPSMDVRRVATGVSIPMQGSAESLNAAMAGSIILFEAARQRTGNPLP